MGKGKRLLATASGDVRVRSRTEQIDNT
jgi:hypothetical protein